MTSLVTLGTDFIHLVRCDEVFGLMHHILTKCEKVPNSLENDLAKYGILSKNGRSIDTNEVINHDIYAY